MGPLDQDALLKLYEVATSEHRFFMEHYQNQVAFFYGVISAVLAATGAALFTASQWYHFAFLCLGPLAIFAISNVALAAASRTQRSVLEAITVRAKLERQLGLTARDWGTPGADTSDWYWGSEPLVPARFLKGRKAYRSSDAFVTEQLRAREGHHALIVRVFHLFQWSALLIFVGTVYLAVSRWN